MGVCPECCIGKYSWRRSLRQLPIKSTSGILVFFCGLFFFFVVCLMNFRYVFMNKKLVIGIDIDAHLRKSLARQVKQWNGLPLRLHDAQSYHIPLLQLGWVSEDAVGEVVQALSALALDTPMTSAQFAEIAPVWKKKDQEGDLSQANALWCKGVPSEDLKSIYDGILASLDIPHAPVKNFAPHIVLGQMRKEQWQQLDSFPQMQQDFAVETDVTQIALMEQMVEDGKVVFAPIEVFELQ